MKVRKRRIEPFTFYDHTGIEAHLEKMAAKGWEFFQISTVFWHYRRAIPKKTHYAVTYFPQASEFDPEPSEGQQTFRDYCEEAGWKFVTSSAQMQVFCNDQENPVPIETDAAVQVENIHKVAKKSFFPSFSLFLFAALLQMVLFFWRFLDDPVSTLSSSTNLFTAGSWTIFFIYFMMELITYFLWYRKAREAACLDGSFIATKGHRQFQRATLYLVLLSFVLWGISLGVIPGFLIVLFSIFSVCAILFLVISIKNYLKRRKTSAGRNRVVTLVSCVLLSFGISILLAFSIFYLVNKGVFSRKPIETYEFHGMVRKVYQDELPLTIEDMMENDYDGYSYVKDTEGSILVSRSECRQHPRLDALDMPQLEYTITDVKLSMLYPLCVNGILKKYESEEDIPEEYRDRLVKEDASLWSANEVYHLYSAGEPQNRYVVCWSGRIVTINFSWEPTAEQISIVADRLMNINEL